MGKTKKKIYVAGPLCEEEGRKFLEKIERLCKELGFETFLPHRDVGICSSIEDVSRIFEGDIIFGMKDVELVVAVLDGFALVVHRSLLDLVGSWPVGTPVGYSLYDYWLCCVAHRFGYRVRLVGIRCHHLGGLTAVGMGVAKGSGEAHVAAHRWLYDNFADVLPWDARGDN